jgi:hypothetical protein
VIDRTSQLVSELRSRKPETHGDRRALFAARVAHARNVQEMRAAFADYARAVAALLKQ